VGDIIVDYQIVSGVCFGQDRGEEQEFKEEFIEQHSKSKQSTVNA
jgi:hypothetical protein